MHRLSFLRAGALLAGLLLTFVDPVPAAVHSVSNAALVVQLDDATGRFSVQRAGAAAGFLRDGDFGAEVRSASVVATTDPVFGAGRGVRATLADGREVTLTLHAEVPFVFVRSTLVPAGKARREVDRIGVATYALDLGRPGAELRALGTAGLTEPNRHPGSYVFLAVADPATRRGVVTGWLTHDRASGVVFSRITNGAVAVDARADYGRLRPAADRPTPLETLVIGHFDDARLGLEQYADLIARQYAIRLRPRPSGYCTWYSDRHGGAGDEKAMVELADFVARELKPYGFDLLQIDDGWQDGGQYEGPRRGFERVKTNGAYAGGMKPVAEAIAAKGLMPGIWFMPFARNHEDPEYATRGHWFVRRTNGLPYETTWGGTSLDLTHPEVQAHLRALVGTIRSWGYPYFKMDGLWTGSASEQVYVNDGYKEDHLGNHAPFHNPDVTNIEMMRNGLKLVRDAAGPDVFLSGCCMSQNMRSFSGALGLVDSMRIGPDNKAKWGNYKSDPKGGTIATGPLRGSRLYFLHGRTWWNDPDPYYVRASIPIEHARILLTWVAISGQFHLNSDWLPALPKERLELIRRTVPPHAATARPVDYFDSILPSIWHVTDTNAPVRRDVIGLFNWDKELRVIECAAERAGLDPDATYHAFDFWYDAVLPPFRGKLVQEVAPEACRVIAVRKSEGRPLLLSTSRHVTQGIVDVRDETWDAATGTLSAVNRVVGNDPVEIRVAGLDDGGLRWIPGTPRVSAEDEQAGVTIQTRRVHEGVLRATIKSPVSREVRWSVSFTNEPAEERVRLTPPPGPAPRINGPKIYGARPGNPFLYRIPCTGTRPMRFSADGLPPSLTLDPATGIITGTTPPAGRHAITLRASNAVGSAQRAFTLVAGDSLALTPTMGYNTWYAHFTRVTDATLRQAADAMITNGMADAGYQYVNVDDCWMQAPELTKFLLDPRRVGPARDTNGIILPNVYFPDMKALTEYIHARGLKAGIYSSPGPLTCTGSHGSHQFEALDARTYVEWGFDFLKYDWCSYSRITPTNAPLEKLQHPFALMHAELAKHPRDIIYNLCQYGMGEVWKWGRDVGGHSWRTAGDLGFELDRFFDIAIANARIGEWNGPGGWNDPDYLQIGPIGAQKGRLFVPPYPCPYSPNEQYALMSLWCLLPAPLFYSGDVANLDDFTLGILCNPEVIDVNQDILGKSGRVISIDEKRFLMVKELEDGALAVGLFNRGDTPADVSATWQQLGIRGPRKVRDLWRQQDLAPQNNTLTARIPRHGVALYRLSRE
jgi:hypothetical protein